MKNVKSQNDIEKSWLVRGADFDRCDIPFIHTATDMPTSLLPFSKRNETTDFSKWIHFYESDNEFVQILRKPKNYVPRLKKFGGIIAPDFSICPDYPWPLQIKNKYWNHALAYWLSTQGIPVIPNVRWGDKHSFVFCFNGIEKNSVVAVGTHGQLQRTDNERVFLEGLPVMITTLSPHTIIVYGKAPNDIFGQYRTAGIRIIHFPSATEQYFNDRKDEVKMGGGYSDKFTGTRGAVGEHKHYQPTIFDKVPARTKSNGVDVGITGSVDVGPSIKMDQCCCCEEFTIPRGSQNEICSICGWIDDNYQNTHPDSLNGKNPFTLSEARRKYHGV